VLASAIDPGFLTPVNLQGQLFVDGGLMHITPLKEAIDAGATEIDIVQASPIYDSVNFPLKASLVALALRAISLMCDSIQTSDLKLCDAYNQLVLTGKATDKRLINYTLYRPEPGLVPDSLDFSPASIRAMIDRGYNDAVLRRG
jgi:predicted patatin/cPLA2 family phospholipase